MRTLLSITLCLSVSLCFGQLKEGTLFDTLKTLDSNIFEASFETCDIAYLESVIADDLEFYHDQGGLTNGRERFLEITKQNLCNNVSKPKRVLEPTSLEVFPLYKNGVLYGAIQKGVHSFYADIEGTQRKTSVAKFTHLWLKQGEHWILKRVLSYDHQSPKEN